MPEIKVNVLNETGSFLRALLCSERFEQFFRAEKPDQETAYLTLSVPFENIDPLAVLELIGKASGSRFFWERPDHELALAAGGRVAQLKSTGIGRFDYISQQSSALFKRAKTFSDINHSMAGAHLVGGFSFFDHPPEGSWRSLGNTAFVLPEWLLIRDGQFSILNITRTWAPSDTTETLRQWYIDWYNNFVTKLQMHLERSRILKDPEYSGREIVITETATDLPTWTKRVEQAIKAIKENKFRKIVLARELRIPIKKKISATKLIHSLRREYPSCYSFLFQLNAEAAFLGSTPEKLLSLQSPYIKTEALAGSISRGKTATRDAINEKKLLESTKDLEEHDYVLQVLREKLSSITESLVHPPGPVIKKYANVQHLCTPVAATLSSSHNAIDILGRLHPTPAVGGFPQHEAVQYIQPMEQIERGWYAGPFGWFNSNRRAEFSVAIRSGLVSRSHVRFFAGAGIVENSDPLTEWEETRLKFIPMQRGLEYANE